MTPVLHKYFFSVAVISIFFCASCFGDYNGTFENGSGIAATGWTVTGNVLRSTDNPRSGSYCMNFSDGSTAGSAQLKRDIGISIPGSIETRVSVFSRGILPGNGETAKLTIEFFKNGSSVKISRNNLLLQSADWSFNQLYVTTPSAGCDNVRVTFDVIFDGDGSGSFAVDDFEFSSANSTNLSAAFLPWPVNGAMNVSRNNLVLKWSPGKSATSSNIYWGTSSDKLVLTGSTGGNYYQASTAPNCSIYYWRIDSVNSTGNVVPGPVWQFTIAPTGDVTNDGGVDFNDFKKILDKWLSNDLSVDLNANGVVDLNDYAQMADNWGLEAVGDVNAVISVDLNDNRSSFLGFGWNVHAAMFQYANWNAVKYNLDSMQMQFARVLLHPEWWQPQENQFTPTSTNMTWVYNFLDYCNRNNVTVMAHNWWTGGKYDETTLWPNHYWWLANCCHLDPSNAQNKWSSIGWWGTAGPETDYPYSTDLFGQMVGKIANYMVNTKGFGCVKYFGIWNEPGGLWALNARDMNGDGKPDFVYPDNFYELYNKTSYYLNYYGLQDRVKLVGSDITAADNDSMSDFGNTLSASSGGQRVDNYLGVMSFHSYNSNGKYQSICANAKAQISSNDFDGQNEPILVGEIGDSTLNLSTQAGMIANSLDSAKKMILFSKQGAYAVARWWYNGSDDGWTATSAQGGTIVPQNFNPMKLFANGIPNTSTDRYITATSVNNYNGDYLDAASIKYQQGGSNKLTILAVNDGSIGKKIAVYFNNLATESVFQKSYIDLNDVNCPIISGGQFSVTTSKWQFTYIIPAKCLVVYKQL
jgi:hypothetical protein